MSDIYKAPEAQLTEAPSTEGYGSLERGVTGQFQFFINDILNEAWAKTKGNKLTVFLAAILYLVVVLPVTFLVPVVLGALGFATELVPGEPIASDVIVGAFLNQVIVTVVSLPLGAGLFMMGLKMAAGVAVSPTEVVSYFHKTLPLAITALIMYIMIAIGLILLVLPGIYLMVAYYLAVPLVVEKGLSPWQALEASRKAVSKCWFRFVGLGLLVWIIVVISVIPLFIGLIWTVPLMLIAFGVVYRNIFGIEAANAA
ncbi:MAG: DUF975 family protein [Gammaproteobacteria bacterium]|nr:DUF975 family protein [Gammaproteobacteria bacterium]MDH5800667.1 DUF975 family protein [Gammaproteobacteria bacterium]